jgi:uncharacterized protein YozE (UPF0346 family)
MGFYDWMMQYKGHDSPRGDLADDIARDRDFPKDGGYQEILEHLELRAKLPNIVPTFKRAWRSFQNSQGSR